MKNKIELLNSEGAILTAKKIKTIGHSGHRFVTDYEFEITDRDKNIVDVLTKKRLEEFTRGGFSIIDSRGNVWNYSQQPGSMKPDLKTLDEFIGIDTTGKTY